MAKFVDLTGLVYGKLTVLGRGETHITKSGNKVTKWLCSCECGNRTSVMVGALRQGVQISCGCHRKANLLIANKLHNMSKAEEYRIWTKVKDRCNNPKSDNYHNYGGRGIKVCKEWDESFSAFYASVGKRPSAAHSLGRIDNNGNYEPGNVRWETPLEQAKNRRTSRYVEYQGQTLIAHDWDRVFGYTLGTTKDRLNRGWSMDEIAKYPVGFGRRIREVRVYEESRCS